MRKLTAGDLDGTLLQNGACTWSEQVIEQMKPLKKRGTGVYKGKVLHKDVFDRALAEEMLHSILNKEGLNSWI